MTNSLRIILLFVLLIPIGEIGITQILTFYKIQNDKKILVYPDAKVLFQLDDSMSTSENLLVEVNLELLKQTTQYNTISLAVGFFYDDTSFSSYDAIKLNFDSELFKNVYATEKTLSVNFFKPTSDLSDPKNKYFFDSSTNFNPIHATRSWVFELTGTYKTGSETYVSNNIEKQKDIFSPPEKVPNSSTIIVQFETTSTADLNRQYELYIHPDGRAMGEINGVDLIKTFLEIEYSELKRITKELPDLGETDIYMNVAEAIRLIELAKRNAILNEPDKQRALEMLKVWNYEYPYLFVSSNSSETNLLLLNQQLKGITDVNEMLNLFKNFKGR